MLDLVVRRRVINRLVCIIWHNPLTMGISYRIIIKLPFQNIIVMNILWTSFVKIVVYNLRLHVSYDSSSLYCVSCGICRWWNMFVVFLQFACCVDFYMCVRFSVMNILSYVCAVFLTRSAVISAIFLTLPLNQARFNQHFSF